MNSRIAVRKSGMVIYYYPDVCLTPIGGSLVPVPYPVISRLEDGKYESNNVMANGRRVVLFDQSIIPNTVGNEAGTGGGLKSRTTSLSTWPMEHNLARVRTNGKFMIRVGDFFNMNGRPPNEKL